MTQSEGEGGVDTFCTMSSTKLVGKCIFLYLVSSLKEPYHFHDNFHFDNKMLLIDGEAGVGTPATLTMSSKKP